MAHARAADTESDSIPSIDSDVEEFIVASNNIMLAFLDKCQPPERECWVNKFNKGRATSGEHASMFNELRKSPELFKGYYRLTIEEFDSLYNLVQYDISGAVELKLHGGRPDFISSTEKLAMTICFLANGGSVSSLARRYKMGITSAFTCINDTISAIIEKLKPSVLPDWSIETCEYVANGFWQRWQFPNCIGAIDGKHMTVQSPDSSGAMYYNYKGAYSIVLLAVADSKYKFTHLDIGEYGKSSDGGTFKTSMLGRGLENATLPIPAPSPLEPGGENVPYFMVGDEAFPLKNYLMRPFPGSQVQGHDFRKVYNYRLSRARHVIENAFGILVARFRILKSRMEMQPPIAGKIVEACCILHNYILSSRSVTSNEVDEEQLDHTITPTASWRNDFPGRNESGAHLGSVQNMGSHNYTTTAKETRDFLVQWFSTSEAGMVDWQIDAARKQYG